MPVLNYRFQGTDPAGKTIPGSVILRQFGVRVPVQVGVHAGLAKKLQTSGESIPPPKAGQALFDTGATVTSIDKTVAEELGLVQTGTRKLGTAGGPVEAPTYAFTVIVTGSLRMDCAMGVGCDLSGQGIIILLGMDLLASCVMILNGPDGTFSLSM